VSSTAVAVLSMKLKNPWIILLENLAELSTETSNSKELEDSTSTHPPPHINFNLLNIINPMYIQYIQYQPDVILPPISNII
jgi:hypothetical protein